MDQFESENPGIKVDLLSGPYADTQQQVVAGAAAGTLSDVVGLDGAWVSDLVKQGALANLSDLMTQAGFDPSQLGSTVDINGSTYMIPTVNFVYPMFVNNDLLSAAGITTPPSTRTEFAADAKQVTNASNNVYGWVLPLGLDTANGIQNDVMSWVWASGGSMMKNGQPNIAGNADIMSALQFIQQMYNDQVIVPGALSLQEQDKVNNFTNGRVAMMIDSLAHITMIRQANPNLNFSVIPIPAADGYTGTRGIPYASWGIGVSQNSQHPAEAWKLVQFLMNAQNNAKLAELANAFPNNKQAQPDYSTADPVFQEAYQLYQQQTPINEFQGLPTATALMQSFDTEFQKALDQGQSLDQTLTNIQAAWAPSFGTS
ncbi:MAG: sugar ABC transporter substrate-binding protein [Propionibacteriaceae bacterium]|nr:sugar ABC transporter substrate-binding protein [Propionibacteriaceae bacterium]